MRIVELYRALCSSFVDLMNDEKQVAMLTFVSFGATMVQLVATCLAVARLHNGNMPNLVVACATLLLFLAYVFSSVALAHRRKALRHGRLWVVKK